MTEAKHDHLCDFCGESEVVHWTGYNKLGQRHGFCQECGDKTKAGIAERLAAYRAGKIVSRPMTDNRLLLPNIANCKRHCWCAYLPGDPLIQRLGADLIVIGMRNLAHKHKQPHETCLGCALEEGTAWIQ